MKTIGIVIFTFFTALELAFEEIQEILRRSAIVTVDRDQP